MLDENGNYVINAQGNCEDNGVNVGWDDWEDFPKRLENVDRKLGYIHLAKEVMKII